MGAVIMAHKAKFVREITVIDPDTLGEVQVAIYKHDNGGMFGIDSSYADQVLDENDSMEMCMADPFEHSKNIVILED
jgi:hypothetical protein